MHNFFHMEFESDNQTLDSSFDSDAKFWDQKEINMAVTKINNLLKQKLIAGFKKVLVGFLENHPEKTDALIRCSKRCLAFNRPKESLDMIERAHIASCSKDSSVRCQIDLFYSQVLLKNNNPQKSLQILDGIEYQGLNIKEHELRVECFRKIGLKTEMEIQLKEVQKYLDSHYSLNSLQKGLFLLKKGKYLSEFDEFESSVSVINKSIQILIKNKLDDKCPLAQAYLSLAEIFYLLDKPFEENINLVCAINVLERSHRHEELRVAAQKRLIDSQIKLKKHQLALNLLHEVCKWNQKKFGTKHPQTQHWEFKKNKMISILENDQIEKKQVVFHRLRPMQPSV